MENQWTLLKDDLSGIPPRPSGFCGYVYAVEMGDCLKIGRTQSPENRLKSLISYSKNYADIVPGKILISPPHTNHVKNENLLHKHFKGCRKSGELFRLSAQEFLDKLPAIEFLNETEKAKARCDEAVETFKAVVLGVNNPRALQVIEGGKSSNLESPLAVQVGDNPPMTALQILKQVTEILVEHEKRLDVLEERCAELEDLLDKERRKQNEKPKACQK